MGQRGTGGCREAFATEHEVGRLDLEKGGSGEDLQLAYLHPSTSDRVLQVLKESDGIILKDM